MKKKGKPVWRDWDSNHFSCNPDPGKRVQVKLKNGQKFEDLSNNLRWHRCYLTSYFSGDDIVKWRPVVKTKEGHKWNDWEATKGSDNPAPGKYVQVKLANGKKFKNPSYYFRWSKSLFLIGGGDNIIKWRLSNKKKSRNPLSQVERLASKLVTDQLENLAFLLKALPSSDSREDSGDKEYLLNKKERDSIRKIVKRWSNLNE